MQRVIVSTGVVIVGGLLALILARTGNDPDDVALVPPTSVTTEAQQRSTTAVVRPEPSTTTSTSPSFTIAPVNSDWFGLVVGVDDGLTFIELPGLTEVGRVEGIGGATFNGSCTMALVAENTGLLVGTETMPGGGETLVVPWQDSTEAGAILPRPLLPAQAARSSEANSVTVSVENSDTDTVGPTLHVSGLVEASTQYPELAGRSLGIHAMEGPYLLLRAEPSEPACDRGTVFLIDLTTGDVPWCADQSAAVLLPVSEQVLAGPGIQTLPAALDPTWC